MKVEVKNVAKKSVEEREYFVNEEGRGFEVVTGWRWGRWVLDLEEGESIDPNETMVVTDYSIEDAEYDDGFHFSIESDDLSKDELESLYLWYDVDGYDAFEKAGYSHEDTEVIVFGGITVEEVC